jgi:hypothetical protein
MEKEETCLFWIAPALGIDLITRHHCFLVVPSPLLSSDPLFLVGSNSRICGFTVAGVVR